MLAARARAIADRKRQDAQDESHRRHEDRPQPQARRLDGRRDRGHALRLQLARELDDQDRVLRRQTDGRQEADLEVHVIRQAAQVRGEEGAQDAKRHHQDHRERDRPAFVERSQAQKHHQHRDGIKERCLGARQALLVGQTGPFEADAARQLFGELLELVHRLAGTLAGCRLALDLER